MRFLLYNIRYGTGTGRGFHWPLPFSGYLRQTGDNVDKIGEFIQSVNPDVVGLIEVDSGSFRANQENQAKALADRIRHRHVYRNKYRADSMVAMMPVARNQGNAFLTNRDIVSQRFHYLNNGTKRLVIELELADVTLFLVHLSLHYRQRQVQLAELSAMINAATKPVIVAGDFNVFRGDRELGAFLATTGLKSANLDGQPSFPSRYPFFQLDYILHSNDIKADGFMIPPVQLSDHSPLVCDFKIDSNQLS